VEQVREAQAKLDAIGGTLFPSVPHRGAGSIAEHARLIDLIEAGRPAGVVERAARQHKLNFREAAARMLLPRAGASA
jgi:DNA-binding GntR family transcriptional regulator